MNLTEQFNQHMDRTKPAKKEKVQPVQVKQIEPRENMNAFQESLSKCTYGGNTVWLPSEMLDNYKDIRAALLNAGATYKKNSFIFPNDAEPYINRLMGGDKVNIKKEFQFFGTPDELADELVFQAQIEPTHSILEPSGGQGAIIRAIVRVFPNLWVHTCELMEINQDILEKMRNTHFICEDFLKIDTEQFEFDRIIANPPFSKNQDIDHIYKMYECLKPGGRIVTIASKHWQHSTNKKEIAFKAWLKKLGADIEEVPAGAFKESGTTIATCIIIINKTA
jgi:Dimethyladenosine transferase (rRNA methylation)